MTVWILIVGYMLLLGALIGTQTRTGLQLPEASAVVAVFSGVAIFVLGFCWMFAKSRNAVASELMSGGVLGLVMLTGNLVVALGGQLRHKP